MLGSVTFEPLVSVKHVKRYKHMEHDGITLHD